MIFIVVGIFIVVAALFIARGFGMFELLRLRAAGFPPITAPKWDRVAPSGGWFTKLDRPDDRRPLLAVPAARDDREPDRRHHHLDDHDRLDLDRPRRAHLLVLGTVSPGRRPRVDVLRRRDRGSSPAGSSTSTGTPATASCSWSSACIFTLTLPFVTRGLTWVHYGIARGMLSAFLSEELRQQVTGLASSRSAAVAAEGTALRRLERDIHDGPQQRLVRLQMDLAAADRKLDKDPKAARVLSRRRCSSRRTPSTNCGPCRAGSRRRS